MVTISLRMDAEDAKLIKEYAKAKNITVSTLLRNAVLEKFKMKSIWNSTTLPCNNTLRTLKFFLLMK